MPSQILKVVMDFIAGALAVVIFHQGAYVLLKQVGLPLQGAAWNMAPAANAYGMPSLFNLMFWGGLWGILYALIADYLPGPSVLKGLVFGMIFPMLLGSWLIVALLKGQPILSGVLIDGNLMRLRTGFLLNGAAFGIGLGLLYALLTTVTGIGARAGADAR